MRRTQIPWSEKKGVSTNPLAQTDEVESPREVIEHLCEEPVYLRGVFLPRKGVPQRLMRRIRRSRTRWNARKWHPVSVDQSGP